MTRNKKHCASIRTASYAARSAVTAVAVLTGFALSAFAEDLPDPDGVRRDELLADWLAQDSGVKVNEDSFAGDVAGRYRLALAKHGLAKEDGESWDAALLRYRAACMKRRSKRLAKVLAMAPRWVYARDRRRQVRAARKACALSVSRR